VAHDGAVTIEPQRILLIGMMGAGKSTVGRRLATRLGLNFVDADTEIEAAAGMSIAFVPPAPGTPDEPALVAWRSHKGPYTTNGVAISIIATSDRQRTEPDLFIFGLPAFFRGYFPGYAKELLGERNLFTWAILKAHTENTAGSVTLRSTDPRDVPSVNFRYFHEGNDVGGDDLRSVATGVRLVRRLMASAGDCVKREILPGDDVQTPGELERFVKTHAWGHHACGTCRIGPASDRMAVVDSRFRVHGIEGLRVVDASVFPRIPGFFIVTPVYMVSEKATDVILEDAGLATGLGPMLRRGASRLVRRAARVGGSGVAAGARFLRR